MVQKVHRKKDHSQIGLLEASDMADTRSFQTSDLSHEVSSTLRGRNRSLQSANSREFRGWSGQTARLIQGCKGEMADLQKLLLMFQY